MENQASSWLDLKWRIKKSNLLSVHLDFVLEIDVAEIGISERIFLNINLWGCGVINKIFQVFFWNFNATIIQCKMGQFFCSS